MKSKFRVHIYYLRRRLSNHKHLLVSDIYNQITSLKCYIAQLRKPEKPGRTGLSHAIHAQSAHGKDAYHERMYDNIDK